MFELFPEISSNKEIFFSSGANHTIGVITIGNLKVHLFVILLALNCSIVGSHVTSYGCNFQKTTISSQVLRGTINYLPIITLSSRKTHLLKLERYREDKKANAK